MSLQSNNEIAVLRGRLRRLYDWIKEQEKYSSGEQKAAEDDIDGAIYSGSKIALHFTAEEMKSVFSPMITFDSE